MEKQFPQFQPNNKAKSISSCCGYFPCARGANPLIKASFWSSRVQHKRFYEILSKEQFKREVSLPVAGWTRSFMLSPPEQATTGNLVAGERRLLVSPNPLQFHALDSIQDMPGLKYEIQLNESAVRV